MSFNNQREGPSKMAAAKTTGASSPVPLTLSEVIDGLRQDLLSSIQKRPDAWSPLFRISEAVVETQVIFKRSLKVSGKIDVFVVQFGPEGQEESTASHKVTLRLVPIGKADAEGGKLRVRKTREDPLMRGTADE